MKLNLEEMREIARTLPIGYYLGRKVPVFVEDGNRAYCDVVKGDVHIGVGLLQTAADHIDATDAAEWDRETLLRCLLYHEIGHLLLTPKWYKVIRVKNANGNSYREEKSNTILNIFEDERLECILSKYFMGVKFRKFVKLVCKGEGGGRKDDIAKIYRAIRLRDAPKDVSDAVDAAIKDLAYIISVTDEWGFNPDGRYVYNMGLYSEEVNDLVAKILDSKEESGGGSGQSQQSQGRSQSQSQSQSQEQSEQEQSKQDSPEQPAPKEQSEQEKPDGEQKDEQKDDKSDGESDDKPDADDKSDAEDDSKAEENSDSEENSGGEGDGDDGSDGESDEPDEEDSEGDDGEGDADVDGDADADGDDSDGESDSDGDGDQGNGDESDEVSDGDAKDDGEDADDADDSGDDDSDGGVDGDDGEDESSDGDATGDDADASDTEDAEDTDGEASCADKVFATPTSDIENVLRRFAQRIAKQKGAQAAGRWSALTGRIDPRRDAQDKDRIFRRSSDVGDAINTAVHLTLWVDTSGSFSRSVPLLNQILAATYRAMKMSGGKLDVDVVKMNYGAEVAGQNDWQIVAYGGNNINSSYVDAWRKTRKKNKRNIDVVVFDGEACGYYGNAKLYIDEIVKQIWDNPDCHLVVDNTNGDWAGNLKRAHVTLLTGNYAESLQDEVIKLLDRIL